MGFDASGTFTRWGGSKVWQGDAASNIKILATRHDDHDQELANGLTECLTRSGKGAPAVDIPWGGRKITNLASPTQPQDAATKDYVDTLPGWEKSKNLGGSDLDGRLNFTGPSGVNGITWTYVDVSWVARHSEPSKTSNRLVMNNSVAPNTTGDAVGDVFIIDEVGRINNNGTLSSNLSFDGTSWRTISPGTATLLTYLDGTFKVFSNDVATITNAYAVATLRDFYKVQNVAGSCVVTLDKSASAKYAQIGGTMAGNLRWLLDLGNITAETATDRVGSDFNIYSYNNAGAAGFAELVINRLTHKATFGGEVSGSVITTTQNFDSVSTVCILSATSGGSIRLRPDGPTASGASETIFTTTGDVQLSAAAAGATGGLYGGCGLRGKAGQTGSYGSYWQNMNWNGSTLTMYAGNSTLGQVAWQCDYRIKKDVEPLPSMWDKVKSLNPIRYTQKAYEVWIEDDTPRWGFMAHELQERLFEGAASGVKDGPDVQSPNLLAIIAGLTKALQEAMARIEALEAAA